MQEYKQPAKRFSCLYCFPGTVIVAALLHVRCAVFACNLQISLIVIRGREKAKADAGFALPPRRCESGK